MREGYLLRREGQYRSSDGVYRFVENAKGYPFTLFELRQQIPDKDHFPDSIIVVTFIESAVGRVTQATDGELEIDDAIRLFRWD